MQLHFCTLGVRAISVVWIALIVASALPVSAQKTVPRRPPAAERTAPSKSEEPPAPTAHDLELGDTVALLPWSYRNGKEAALQSAREACNHLLLETGFNVFLVKPLSAAVPPVMPNTAGGKKGAPPFEHLLDDSRALFGKTITGPTNTPFVMPTVQEMTAIGERLQTRYVLAGRAQWSMRNVWVGISNRAKSLCTVDVQILDMKSRALVLDARNVQGDSTENKNMYNTLSGALSLNPLPLVLPGSVTPQEQRAVAIATAKAMEPWLRTQRMQAALAQADQSSEAASEPVASAKFSALVHPINSMQATLHVTDLDQKEFASLDADAAKLFALHTVSLEYKEPNNLRLHARNQKEVLQTLLVDEDTRRFAVGENSKGAAQDISNAPTRRLSLLDFCGLLAPGMFDSLRARLAGQEKLANTQTVVYDLSYWRGDDISYQRIWIDPAKRLVLKREVYNHSSKLQAIYLYQRPVSTASDNWVPSRVEIQNAARKRIASFSLDDVTIDEGSVTESSTR